MTGLPMVETAIGRARAVFAAYPLRAAMPACPHCGPADPADLEAFAYKAVTTWGDADDLRHLLPDLLARAWTGELRVHPAVVSTKLVAAGWRGWPIAEQGAVDDFLRAAFVQVLSRYPSQVGVTAAIAAVAEATGDVRGPLDDWHVVLGGTGDSRTTALRHLADLATATVPLLRAGAGLERLLWTPDPQLGAHLRTWLLGQTTLLQLERATFDYASAPFADALSQATRSLVALRDGDGAAAADPVG